MLDTAEPHADPVDPEPDAPRDEDHGDLATPRTRAWRLGFTAAYVVFLLALVAGSVPQRVGDGTEYLAVARHMAHLNQPAMTDAELTETEEAFREYGHGYAVPLHITWADGYWQGGRQDFAHFWMYPFLAVPGVWITWVLGIPVHFAMAITNMALLAVAFWVALPRLRYGAMALLFGSPILWWTDKSHTEAFTFSLLVIAFATLRDKPWWALIAGALASSQNLGIALLLPIFVGIAVWRDRGRLRDRRMWWGTGAAFLISLIHPVYFLLRLGVIDPQTFCGCVREEVPNLNELLAVVVDSNIGLLPRYPLFGVAMAGVLGALLVKGETRRRLLEPEVVLLPLMAVILLFSMTQTPNFNHGGTYVVSRYAMWLIPLSIPVLGLMNAWRARSVADGALLAVGVGALTMNMFAYHPQRSESYLFPTRLATWLWSNHPSWENPVPEIFVERIRHRESHPVVLYPVAMPTCSKVLVVDGVWPENCPAPPLPESCDSKGEVCYANRARSAERPDLGYRFVTTRNAGVPKG